MRCRVRRNHGFKPINVRLRFDSLVEYECFRSLMGDYEDTPNHIAKGFTGILYSITGVKLSSIDVKECLKGIMKRVYLKLPSGKEKA
jgi:hypothetical protein